MNKPAQLTKQQVDVEMPYEQENKNQQIMKTKNQLLNSSIKGILILSLIFWSGISILAQKITIQGNQFFVDTNKRIWLNGVNTPWNNWNDFGGSFNRNWWNSHFQTLKSYGINSSRVWISCNGGGAVQTNSSGVTGVSSTFYKDCDTLFAIAQRNGIYIDATMISFDHFKNTNANYLNWRNIVTSQAASQTFIDNYLIPFVNRYKSNPYLFAIDFCNEPEWVSENTENGQLPVSNLQRFFAMCAVAVHNNSNLPVTIGSACIKWNSDNPGCVGNYWKNSALQAAYNDPKAFLDFYCIHYYSWVQPWYKSPFEKSPADYGINDRPVIIEESPGKDAGLAAIPMTLIQSYESALAKGYQGNMPWTSNGVDSNGDITTIGPGTLSFKNNHPGLVYPLLSTAVAETVSGEPFEIYPNPSSGKFTLSGTSDKGQGTSFEIYNMLGERAFLSPDIKQLTLNEIDLSNSPRGIYIVKLYDGTDIHTKKIVIQN
jgi:hypothetical protein